jgi:hypothetical protein
VLRLALVLLADPVMADVSAGGIAGQLWTPVVPRHGLGFFARFCCFDLLLRAESLEPAVDSAIPLLQGVDQVLKERAKTSGGAYVPFFGMSAPL